MGKILSPAGEMAFTMQSLKREGNNLVIVGRMGVWESEIYLSYAEVLRFFLSPSVLQIAITLPAYFVSIGLSRMRRILRK